MKEIKNKSKKKFFLICIKWIQIKKEKEIKKNLF